MIPQNESNATGSIKFFPLLEKLPQGNFGAVFAVITRILIVIWVGVTLRQDKTFYHFLVR
jgi:hypothetical protein